MAQPEGTMLDGATEKSQIAQIMHASSIHDNEALQKLIDSCSFTDCRAVDVQEASTGYTPLHATIASCTISPNGTEQHGASDGLQPKGLYHDELEKAGETIKLLLENGAIWNQLDRNDETPGCIAFRHGLDSLYQLMVDAGVRAEMLLNRLDEYEELGDEEADDAGEEGSKQQNPEHLKSPSTDQAASNEAINAQRSAMPTGSVSSDSANYLSSALFMSDGKILDEAQNGVMMAWESNIMKRSTDLLLHSPGLKILNIGFGMGIIDSHINEHRNKPVEHHIVEAHPDVLASIKQKGWQDMPGLVIHSGRWQEVLLKLLEEGVTFDAVYYDTFAESYKDFQDFFTEHLLGLLEQNGTWSFFNGMGADRQISYDVYQKIVELDLFEAGFEVEWADVDLPDLSQEWEGVKRKYWKIKQYRLPVCRFMD